MHNRVSPGKVLAIAKESPMKVSTSITDFTPTEVARYDQSALLLSRIERGLTKQIRWEALLRLMRTYECRPDELLTVKENTQRKHSKRTHRAVSSALRASSCWQSLRQG